MAATRWSWETDLDTGIDRMVSEDYAFMGATQSMYLRSGQDHSHTFINLQYFKLEGFKLYNAMFFRQCYECKLVLTQEREARSVISLRWARICLTGIWCLPGRRIIHMDAF